MPLNVSRLIVTVDLNFSKNVFGFLPFLLKQLFNPALLDTVEMHIRFFEVNVSVAVSLQRLSTSKLKQMSFCVLVKNRYETAGSNAGGE